jgi:hypothetical protein
MKYNKLHTAFTIIRYRKKTPKNIRQYKTEDRPHVGSHSPCNPLILNEITTKGIM